MSSHHQVAVDDGWVRDDLLDRFLRYVRVHTTSDPHSVSTPSTERQFDLARMLEAELTAIGVPSVHLDEHCNVIARLPGTAKGPALGFMAHMDTAPDFSGANVNPKLHETYDGRTIRLNEQHRLDPAEYPMLSRYTGDTIITTDGTSLLGADDKAGIAEIMTAVRFLVEHPEVKHPEIEIIFTPDEEIGRGTDTLPVDSLKSSFCFTLDGTDEGTIEASCFTAFKSTLKFTGYSIHPGSARGKLANAGAMAALFVSMLPRSESPEATDGTYGFYCATEIVGSISEATVVVIVRDFDYAAARRRVEYLESLAKTVEGAFPGGTVQISTIRQYLNMADSLREHPRVLELMQEAVRMTGIEPTTLSIRGGTDGARLSEKGIPTPNLFTGGQNLHGRYEWIPASAMIRAVRTVLNLVTLFVDAES